MIGAGRKPLEGLRLLVLGELRLAAKVNALGLGAAGIAAGKDALAFILRKRFQVRR